MTSTGRSYVVVWSAHAWTCSCAESSGATTGAMVNGESASRTSSAAYSASGIAGTTGTSGTKGMSATKGSGAAAGSASANV